jgi:hypothetical protein
VANSLAFKAFRLCCNWTMIKALASLSRVPGWELFGFVFIGWTPAKFVLVFVIHSTISVN